MNERQLFLKLLKKAKRKLLIEHLSQYFVKSILYMAMATVIWGLLARFVVIVHLMEKMVITASIIFLISVVIALWKKPSQRKAAQLFDEFVQEDRVITALHYLQDDTMVSQLQRRDALTQMKSHLPQLEKKRLNITFWKPILLSMLLIGVAIGSQYIPNEVMEQAEQQEIEEELVEKTKEDLEEASKEENAETERLEEIAEETEDLANSKELLEKLLAEEENLELEKQQAMDNQKKLDELIGNLMDNQLEDLADALEQLDQEQVMNELQQLLSEELASLTEEQEQELENVLSELSNGSIKDVSELSQEQLNEMLAQLEEQLNDLLENVNMEQLANMQEQLQEIASNLNNARNKAGLSDSNQLAFGSPSSSSSDGNESSSNGSSSNGQSSSQESENGAGEGGQEGSSGNGTGNGQGSGQGSGNGSGSGSGSGGSGTGSGLGTGNGSGAGFGQGSRELTVPEYLEGEESIEEDFGELGEGSGKQQSTSEGPVLKGTVKSYEEVYGNYSKTYRDSVDRLDLPSYLEDVVKDYFSDLNPEGE